MRNSLRNIFVIYIKYFHISKNFNYVILDSAKDIWGDNKGIEYTIFWKNKEINFKEQLERIDEDLVFKFSLVLFF